MTKAAESQVPVRSQTLKAESGSPYFILGYGPRLKRMTTWNPTDWKIDWPLVELGLDPWSREMRRIHTWEDRGVYSLTNAYFYAKCLARGMLPEGQHILVLAGPTGVGKTHLAQAIAWEWLDDGLLVMFTRVDDLLDNLRRSLRDDSYHEMIELVRRCPLLVLDDLGTQRATDWAGEMLDRIVDWRYVSHLPMIITTNAKSADLAPRIASRLADHAFSIVVQMDATDYRIEIKTGSDRRE